MPTKTKGVVIALTAAALLMTNGLANAADSNAQAATGSVKCKVTVNQCNSAGGCPQKMVITTNSEKECVDKGGKVEH